MPGQPVPLRGPRERPEGMPSGCWVQPLPPGRAFPDRGPFQLGKTGVPLSLFVRARAPRPRAPSVERGPGEARKFLRLEPDAHIHASFLMIMYALRCINCAHAVNVHATKSYLIIQLDHSQIDFRNTNHRKTPWTYQGIGVVTLADRKP